MFIIVIAAISMSIIFKEQNAQTEALTVALFITGLGVGLFMTPNTTSIMTSVGPNRRGVANGMRAMIQNMGFVVGIAVSLAIVTAPLSCAAQHAVYSGQGQLLSDEQLRLFQAQYHVAFEALSGIAISALIASFLRKRATVAAA